MQIAIVGAGRIGSTFAFQLGQAGHELTLVARGPRLAELERAPYITSVAGKMVAVRAAAALDEATPWDLVIVTVLGHQVDAVLPTLAASSAKSVLFVFNTFDSTDRLRDAVGAERFCFAFPNMAAFFVDGKLKSQVSGPGMVTTLSSNQWVDLFQKAGFPTEVQPDMPSYLRSHVAFVLPLMLAGQLAYARKAGVTWAEAKKLSSAMHELFDTVRALGHRLLPGFVGVLAGMPRFLLSFLIWALSRAAAVRDLGEFGPGEARALIDSVQNAAPGRLPELLALRP